MPENELRPKGKTSKEWIDYADEKLGQFKKYHSKRTLFSEAGPYKLPQPLGDEYSRLMSQEEMYARAKGMKYLREEQKSATTRGYKKGGKVRKTGPAILHKGEAVVRVKPRKSARSTSR
jgi:hypothetical protein